MRKYYKYYLDNTKPEVSFLPIDKHFSEHVGAMGGYDASEYYNTKKEFFDKYFYNYQDGRLIYYDRFIRKHLNKEEEALSIGSGRCANELILKEDGFNITCSDLGPINYEKTISLFHDYKFIRLNILDGPSERKYDTIICLSLIYLFNYEELSIFFKNVSSSLKPKGKLILDSAGSSDDNILSNLICDYLTKYEVMLKKIIKAICKREKYSIIKKHHGYRSSDNDIVQLASKAGLVFIEKGNYAFLTDFRRIVLLDRLIDSNIFIKRIFSKIGERIPYIRMFYFEKSRNNDVL